MIDVGVWDLAHLSCFSFWATSGVTSLAERCQMISFGFWEFAHLSRFPLGQLAGQLGNGRRNRTEIPAPIPNYLETSIDPNPECKHCLGKHASRINRHIGNACAAPRDNDGNKVSVAT